MTRKTFGALRKDAAREGRKAGLARASWFFDGNTGDDFCARVLAGLDEGDPMILDTIPTLDLSGQWADGDTADDVLDLIGVTADDEDDEGEDVRTDEDGNALVSRESADDLINDFRDAFDAAVVEEVERVARLHATK